MEREIICYDKTFDYEDMKIAIIVSQYCEKYETFAREVNNNRGVLSKEKPSFLEKVIFFDPKKTNSRRRKIYYKQKNASESFVELCDTLIIEE